MKATISQITIQALHGRERTIAIPVRDNRLVLVGENGTGKSTVANLIYYVLTQQWRRLHEYRFESIEVIASNEVVHLSHEDIEALVAYQSGPFTSELRNRFPPSLLREVSKMLAQESLFFGASDEFLIDRLVEMNRVSRSMAQRLVMDVKESQGVKLKKALASEIQRLESWDFGQFLYLPTYRRIEQDLKSIFRGIEIEEKVREFRDRFRRRESGIFT